MKIFVFGNPFIKQDSAPLHLVEHLIKLFPSINFIVADPNEDFPPEDEKDPIILDTVVNIKKPTMISLDDLKEIEKAPISPHDYDLLMHLFLLKKTGRLRSVRIIGIPHSGPQQ